MKRTYHAPLTGILREAHAACAESAASGAPIDEITAWRAERRAALSRRELLTAAGAVAVVARPRPARAAGMVPNVVVVGAGLAGLSCARSLWRGRGIAARVYEWSNRVGGRVHTLRGYFAGGLTAELHGQFISSEHRRMRGLAAAYGLSLADTGSHLGANTNDTGWFAGRRYTAAQLAADWRRDAWRLFRDAARAAPSASYLHANPTARAWDNMSVTDWVQRYVPGGVDGPLGALCLADVTSEYGSPPERQSALNLVYLLGFDASATSGLQPRDAPILAGTDERYEVVGGNDQIIAGLVGDLPSGAVNLGHRLLAVRETSGGGFVCHFQAGSATADVRADEVVLAIPPTTLRDVELSTVTLSAVQRTAIAGATLGANAKIFIQVAGVPWIADNYTGAMLTDQAVGAGWDPGNTQPGGYGPRAQGLYVGYPGGAPGAGLASRYGLSYGRESGPAPAAMVTDTLAQLEPIFPGVSAAWAAGPRLAYVHDGNIDPHVRGAYSNFLVGQYTAFGGAQSLSAGHLHFAGEHTSADFQGFMEGAVESGLRAAAQI